MWSLEAAATARIVCCCAGRDGECIAGQQPRAMWQAVAPGMAFPVWLFSFMYNSRKPVFSAPEKQSLSDLEGGWGTTQKGRSCYSRNTDLRAEDQGRGVTCQLAAVWVQHLEACLRWNNCPPMTGMWPWAKAIAVNADMWLGQELAATGLAGTCLLPLFSGQVPASSAPPQVWLLQEGSLPAELDESRPTTPLVGPNLLSVSQGLFLEKAPIPLNNIFPLPV